jgi:23S rRNA (adenine-N6)-dimethyltransferase
MKQYYCYFPTGKLNIYKPQYSQNVIRSDTLARMVVDLADLNPEDLVLEIGAGSGSLTKFLITKSQKVLAFENDRRLYGSLIKRFSKTTNLEVKQQDFLDYRLPSMVNYKVIGNIPFVITTKIIKKLLDVENAPGQTFLLLQKEAAFRLLGFSGRQQRKNLFSLRYQPWFQVRIIKHFKRYDFCPVPQVDVVMLYIKKRKHILISQNNRQQYLDLITFCFNCGRKSIRRILQNIFTANQMNRIFNELKICPNNYPAEVRFYQWLALFQVYLKFVPAAKQKTVRGSLELLNLQQKNLQKCYRTRNIFHQS